MLSFIKRDENLKSVNQKLYAFEDFYKELDALVVIKVAAPELVYK
jgi:pantothenate kinase-related protein Tda10